MRNDLARPRRSEAAADAPTLAPLMSDQATARQPQLLSVAAFAAFGPLAMALAGFEVPIAIVALATVAHLAVLRVRPPGRWVEPAGALLAGAALIALAGAPFASVWFAIGAVAGRWACTGIPPHPALPVAPAGLAAPLASLWAMAALRAWNPTYRFDPAPRALTVALLLAVVAGMAATATQRRSLAAATVAWMVVAELIGEGINVTRSVGPLLIAALALIAAAGAFAPGGARWSLRTNVGVLGWALPAMLWCSVNVSVWVYGVRAFDGVGYSAWSAATSTLPTLHTTLIAATATPAALLALLAIGAQVATVGRRGWFPVGEAIAISVGAASLVALAWTVGLPSI